MRSTCGGEPCPMPSAGFVHVMVHCLVRYSSIKPVKYATELTCLVS